jgi:hypothetical protein
MLDYGAARNVGSGWGTRIFGACCVYYSNPDILSALEYAANGVHNGYVTGSTIVAYGNNTSGMTSSGMSLSDAHNAGYYQSQRAQDLANYQSSHGYNQQSAAIGQDQEPGFDKAPISRSLADGASAQGYALNYNYGSADGCYPYNGGDSSRNGSCANGWTATDVYWVSWGSASAVPLPEIYYSSPDLAAQWANINRLWSLVFFGTTGETGAQLTPAQGWDRLSSKTSGNVLDELICFGC